jgi:hypothetical protein
MRCPGASGGGEPGGRGPATAFFYAEVEFPTVEAARGLCSAAPFLAKKRPRAAIFSMSAYWHATRGSDREG